MSVNEETPLGLDANLVISQDLYRSTSKAAAEGEVVAVGLRSGCLATIDACVKARESTMKFKGDVEAMTAFMEPLVGAKILSPEEARLGAASPKLSRLCKIGEYADRLQHQDILRYFLETGCSGHTLIYQTAVLLDQAPEGLEEDKRIQWLLKTLPRGPNVTRQDLLRRTRELKQADKAQDAGEPHDEPIEQTKKGLLAGIEADYDLIVAKPSRSDLRRLEEDYVGPLPRCLRTGEIAADAAVMVVLASVADLPVIQNRLLPGCGFEGVPARVFLISRPENPDVTDAQVVIVSDRTGNPGHLADWFSDGDPLSLAELASRIAPGANKKLQLFASEPTDGWGAIIGEANWSQFDD